LLQALSENAEQKRLIGELREEVARLKGPAADQTVWNGAGNLCGAGCGSAGAGYPVSARTLDNAGWADRESSYPLKREPAGTSALTTCSSTQNPRHHFAAPPPLGTPACRFGRGLLADFWTMVDAVLRERGVIP
jgi:hypothetical protein